MANLMDELTQRQETNGQEIQRIVSNYRKDPLDRKTKDYYATRLQRLEEAWSRFENLDTEIRSMPDVQLSHRYFTTEYYSIMEDVYSKFRDHFTAKLASFDEMAPIDKGSDLEEGAKHPITLDHNQPSSATKSKDSDLGAVGLISAPVHQDSGTKGTSSSKGTESLGDIDTPITRLLRRQRRTLQSLKQVINSIYLDQEQRSRYFYELKIDNIKRLWSEAEQNDRHIWELADDPISYVYDIQDYTRREEFCR